LIAPVAVMPRRTRSFSTNTPLLRIDATFPDLHSNSDSVPAISPVDARPYPNS
jgi:hypothetical protein